MCDDGNGGFKEEVAAESEQADQGQVKGRVTEQSKAKIEGCGREVFIVGTNGQAEALSVRC